jgi:uncharacterized delta-60 repeat protein
MGGRTAIRALGAALAAAFCLAAAPALASASVGNFGMAVQRDGKILVAGGSGRAGGGASGKEFGALARYDRDGSLDPSFGGGDGVALLQALGPLTAIALQPDGRILVTSAVGQLSRLLPNGRPDPSFGVGGYAPPGALSAYFPTTVVVAADGSILVGGMTGYLEDPGEHWYGRLYRYPADGMTSDWIGAMTSGDGRPGEPKSFLNDFLVEPDGSVFGVGTVAPRQVQVRSRAALAQLLPAQLEAANGIYPTGPDPSFGAAAGLVTSNFFPASSYAEAANALARDRGKLVVAGEADHELLVARYSRAGILDPGFGHRGAAVAGYRRAAPDTANAVAVQRDGGILVAGTSVHGCAGGGCSSLLVARFKANGRLDHGFGRDGIVSPSVDNRAYGYPATEVAYAVAAPGKDMFLVGGLVTGRGSSRFFLRRYLADGTPDPSFGNRGRVTTLPLQAGTPQPGTG